MQRVPLVIVIVTLLYWVCQNGVKGDTDKQEEEAIIVEENGKILEEEENKDDTEILDLDSDTTVYKRLQEMPLKLGLQFLAAKYGLSGSLDKTMQGSTYIYDGAKDAVKTMTNLIGEGIGDARYLLFGTK